MKVTKKATFLSLGLITLLLSGIGSVFAFDRDHHNPEKRAQHIMDKVTKKLSLNAEQKDKLAIAKDAALALHQQMHQGKETLGQDIMSVVSNETLNETLILERINAKTEAVQAGAPELVAALAGFYNSLDVEQQAKVRKKLEKKMRHLRDHDDH